MVSDQPGRKVATPRLCGLHKGALSFLFYFFYGAEALGSLVRVAVPTYGMSPWRGPSFLSFSSPGKGEMCHLFLSLAHPHLPGPGSLST